MSWVRENGDGYYRLHDKDIQAFKQDNDTSVITTTPSKSEDVAEEIAQFVKKLIDEKKLKIQTKLHFYSLH